MSRVEILRLLKSRFGGTLDQRRKVLVFPVGIDPDGQCAYLEVDLKVPLSVSDLGEVADLLQKVSLPSDDAP